ncbi:MAG: hypothetical protein H0T61_06940 [Actinobacteria bacterium]|nr:hypothetical protein [Actinomycetota bacterium]
MPLELRALTLDDAPAVAELIAARDAADLDQHDPHFTITHREEEERCDEGG